MEKQLWIVSLAYLVIAILISSCGIERSETSGVVGVDLAEAVQKAGDKVIDRLRTRSAQGNLASTLSAGSNLSGTSTGGIGVFLDLSSCDGTEGTPWFSDEVKAIPGITAIITVKVADVTVGGSILNCRGPIQLQLSNVPGGQGVPVEVMVEVGGVLIGYGKNDSLNLSDAIAGNTDIEVAFTTFDPDEMPACEDPEDCDVSDSFPVRVIPTDTLPINFGEGVFISCAIRECTCELQDIQNSVIRRTYKPFRKQMKAVSLTIGEYFWGQTAADRCEERCVAEFGEAVNVTVDTKPLPGEQARCEQLEQN